MCVSGLPSKTTSNSSSWPLPRTHCMPAAAVCTSFNPTTAPSGRYYSVHPQSDHFPSFPYHILVQASILSHLWAAQPLAWSSCSSPSPPPCLISSCSAETLNSIIQLHQAKTLFAIFLFLFLIFRFVLRLQEMVCVTRCCFSMTLVQNH